MADEEQLLVLKQGVEAWNLWREENPDIRPDLSQANLRRANLRKADLSKAILWRAELSGADLSEANLQGAYLIGANLDEADLEKADLSKANLSEARLDKAELLGANLREANLSKARMIAADLSEADLSKAKLVDAWLFMANLIDANLDEADLFKAQLNSADLSGANLNKARLNEADLGGADLINASLNEAELSGANLRYVSLVDTIVEGVILTDCMVYGISAWGLEGIPKDQSNLIITPFKEPVISVDNLEVAQFIYLLLHNPKIRDAIDTIAKKVVLILGRFNETQKPILESIRDELRKHNYLPILFNWDKPTSRNLVETVSTLAHLSRFVIADITDAKSIPAELEHIVPTLPSVAVQPLMLRSDYEYALFDHIRRYPWVLDVYLYDTHEMLHANLIEHVIDPAEAKARELIPPEANR